MSYEQFVQEIETRIQKKVGDNRKVHIHTAIKNNGRIRRGLTFVEKGINVSPTIYLEEYYERFVRGGNVEMIAEQILQLYKSVRVHHSWEPECVKEYESVKDHIIFRLINGKANEYLLNEVPHLPFLDLAIVFYVLVELDDEGERMATMMIKNEHLEWWGKSAEELFQISLQNAEMLLPSELTSMLVVIEELVPVWERPEVTEEDDYMYVLTNNRRSFGAGTILYPERLKAIGMYLKESFYVLPSSVHEVIILPESRAIEKDELQQIVYEINHTQVPDEEILSDNVYYYDIKENKLQM